jgi:hypothetical protein
MAASKSQVCLAGLDPQRSLTHMWSKRNELVNPRLIADVENVAKSVRLLTQARYDRVRGHAWLADADHYRRD